MLNWYLNAELVECRVHVLRFHSVTNTNRRDAAITTAAAHITDNQSMLMLIHT